MPARLPLVASQWGHTCCRWGDDHNRQIKAETRQQVQNLMHRERGSGGMRMTMLGKGKLNTWPKCTIWEQLRFYFSSRFRKRAHCVRTIFLPFLTFRSLGIIISWIEQILSIHQKNRGSQLKHKLTISVRWDLFIIPVSWRICCPKLGKLRKIVWRNVTRSRANGMSCTNPELGTPVWEWLPRVGIACG